VGLLLACLLLLARLLACPSPSGLAPGFCLSFSSWTCSWLGLASNGLHGFAGCDLVMMCKNCCCSWCGAVLDMCVCCFPWCSSPGRLLALLAAVVLPAQPLHAVTKLLVSCLSPWLDLILTWPCCDFCYVHNGLVPQ
jgi:hypothetical protein